MISLKTAAKTLKTISLLGAASLSISYPKAALANNGAEKSDCLVELDSYLSQSLIEFDQSKEGWRGLSDKEGCTKEAANLIHDYRERNGLDVHILYFHEAQLRLQNGSYRHAFLLLKNSFVEADKFGWNPYVKATMAFANRDLTALKKYRDEILKLPFPEGTDVVDLDGKPAKVPWPHNIKTVNALVKCFDRSYKTAYSDISCYEQ